MLVILFLRGAIPKVKQMSTLVNISNILFSTFMPYYLTIFIFKNLQTIAGVDVYYLIYFLLNYEFGHIKFLNPDLTSKFMLLIHYVLIFRKYLCSNSFYQCHWELHCSLFHQKMPQFRTENMRTSISNTTILLLKCYVIPPHKYLRPAS